MDGEQIAPDEGGPCLQCPQKSRGDRGNGLWVVGTEPGVPGRQQRKKEQREKGTERGMESKAGRQL